MAGPHCLRAFRAPLIHEFFITNVLSPRRSTRFSPLRMSATGGTAHGLSSHLEKEILTGKSKFAIISEHDTSESDATSNDTAGNDIDGGYMTNSRAVRKHLPLTEATFYILVALMEPQHGYAVMQDVEKMSHGNVKLGPGTLYGALTNLEKSKLVRKVGEVDRRKIYVITAFGQEVVDGQVERLKVMVRNTEQKRKHAGLTSSEGG